MDAETRDPVIAFVSASLERYPESEVRDVYKLLYQVYHGAEHAILEVDAARGSLYDEWEQVKPTLSGEQSLVLEPVFIEGVTPPLYRLHFGPAKRAGIDPEAILREFRRAAEEFPMAYPDEKDDLGAGFRAAWSKVGRAIARGEFPLSLEDYAAFSAEMEGAGWPAVHHSEVYKDTYQPHYRLVMDPSIFK